MVPLGLSLTNRKLNLVTLAEPFQMPTITEIISRLGNATYLSKLDLMKGFHQVPVDPESRKYTAFTCRHGKFQYCRMPFGLKNAPAIPTAHAGGTTKFGIP